MNRSYLQPYRLQNPPRIGQASLPFTGVYTLKEDDPEEHAKSIGAIVADREFVFSVSHTGIVHSISLLRVDEARIAIHIQFDSDIDDLFQQLRRFKTGLQVLLSHLSGAPSADASYDDLLAFIAAGQVETFAHYHAYPHYSVLTTRAQTEAAVGEKGTVDADARCMGDASHARSISAYQNKFQRTRGERSMVRSQPLNP